MPLREMQDVREPPLLGQMEGKPSRTEASLSCAAKRRGAREDAVGQPARRYDGTGDCVQRGSESLSGAIRGLVEAENRGIAADHSRNLKLIRTSLSNLAIY